MKATNTASLFFATFVFVGRGWALIVSLLVVSFTGSARATLLYEDRFLLEPFQYTTAVPVAGQSGGAGTFFINPWEHGGNFASDVQFIPSLFPSLTMPGLIRPPAGVALPGSFEPCLGCIPNRISRRFATPWTGPTPPEGTYYIGILANFGSAAAGAPINRALEMWAGTWPVSPIEFDPASLRLRLGYTGLVSVDKPLSMTLKDSSGQAVMKTFPEGLTFATDGQTHAIVMKFELSNSTSDTVSVFLDTVGLTEPATPSVVFTGADFTDGVLNLELDRIGSILDALSGHPPHMEMRSSMDDLRVGTTFADVAYLVPEPGTTVLGAGTCAGLVLAGWMARRRRA